MSKINYWKIEVKKLVDLQMADYNPRTISSRSFEGLQNSLNTFGIVQPIVWNELSGNIVGGHQRYQVLRKEGVKETKVVVVRFNETEEIACNIALNSSSIRGEYTNAVKDLLDEVEDEIGFTFEDVRLSDLKQEIDGIEFEQEEVEPKEDSGDSDKDDGDDLGDIRDDDIPLDRKVVTCPKCKSIFKLMDRKVIQDKNSSENKVDEEFDLDLGIEGFSIDE